eukprot:TRINITY_DN52032_c0_g1_i1.p2 TRINITY_DN52032_c0_g1~~TRINITY_DN52032_c0_g1_i1.p2  ORF type:complete len:114 (-),score=9.36 TRINITY_DN52032_c0_g1_i1:140-481(-)
MIRRPPRSTLSSSSAASDVYKRQLHVFVEGNHDNALLPLRRVDQTVLQRCVPPDSLGFEEQPWSEGLQPRKVHAGELLGVVAVGRVEETRGEIGVRCEFPTRHGDGPFPRTLR